MTRFPGASSNVATVGYDGLARIRAGTPEEFSRRGLWVHARDLETL
ncbi:hypothetical protein AB4Y72_15090 [Arthrobacter sp. YAF34]